MDHRQVFTERILPLKNQLLKYSFGFLKDRQQAEDAVQETMLRMWNNKERWSALENLEGFCTGVARNLCLDMLRKQRGTFTEVENLHGQQSNEIDPFEKFKRKNMVSSLLKAMTMLPEKQRLCFHLREEDGLPYNEIADLAGITIEQVKVNIFRARNFIKKQVLKEEAYGT